MEATSPNIPPVHSAFTSNSKYLVIAIVLMVIMIGIIAFYLMGLKTGTSSSKAVSSPSPEAAAVVSPTIPLKEEYQNPFDEKTQYANPFEESENPFDALSQ